MRKANGFTLIEMMVTVALVAVLAVIAIPSIQTFIKNTRMSANASALIEVLNFARSEAIKRNVNVDVASDNGDTNWAKGITASYTVGVTVVVLRKIDSLPASMTFTDTKAAKITYLGTGRATPKETFTLCDNRQGETGRTMSISLTGHLRSNTVTCP